MSLHTLSQAMINQPTLWLTCVALVSLLAGSLLNVVIARLPMQLHQAWRNECKQLLDMAPATSQPTQQAPSLFTPHCPKCHTTLKIWHNIAVISYLIQQGRSACCGTTISIRYPMIELLTVFLGMVLAWIMGPSLEALLSLLLVYILIALACIDIDTKLLPDQLTLTLLWLGLLANSLGTFTSLEAAVWGAIGGYLCLWLVHQGFFLTTGKQGIGYGDFKLLAAIGAWLGWHALPIVLLVASTAGIVWVFILRLSKVEFNPHIPFGPFLAISCFINLLFGPFIWQVFSG